MKMLEKIAVEKIRTVMYSINKRCAEDSPERMQQERPSIINDSKKVLEIITALLED